MPETIPELVPDHTVQDSSVGIEPGTDEPGTDDSGTGDSGTGDSGTGDSGTRVAGMIVSTGVDVRDSDSAVPATSPASANDADGPRSAKQLEEEGEIAADYIEELLDITDLDGDIDIDARDGRAYLSVNSSQDSNLRLLSKPDTVNALQELTRIAVQAKTGVFSRLILDVGGSRQTRETELAQLVERAADRIDGGAQSAALPPMSSYERKLVHDLVAVRGFVSQSEGEGADRHTVITRA